MAAYRVVRSGTHYLAVGVLELTAGTIVVLADDVAAAVSNEVEVLR